MRVGKRRVADSAREAARGRSDAAPALAITGVAVVVGVVAVAVVLAAFLVYYFG